MKLKNENNSIYDEEARELHNQTENFSPANDDDNFFSDEDEIAPIDGDEPDDSITEDLNSLPRLEIKYLMGWKEMLVGVRIFTFY